MTTPTARPQVRRERPGRLPFRLRDGRRAVVTFTDRRHGDLSGPRPDPGAVGAPGPWTVLRQVHGATTVVVDRPGGCTGHPGDAAVTAVTGAALAVRVADCAPVAVISPAGAVAVIHAGWRGLMAGVVGSAVDALRDLVGRDREVAVLGPCIHPASYEFSASDLEAVVERFGPAVASRTATGAPALDVPAAVAVALRECGVRLAVDAGLCTARAVLADGTPRFWSHRARRESGRQVLAAWIEPPGPPVEDGS